MIEITFHIPKRVWCKFLTNTSHDGVDVASCGVTHNTSFCMFVKNIQKNIICDFNYNWHLNATVKETTIINEEMHLAVLLKKKDVLTTSADAVWSVVRGIVCTSETASWLVPLLLSLEPPDAMLCVLTKHHEHCCDKDMVKKKQYLRCVRQRKEQYC